MKVAMPWERTLDQIWPDLFRDECEKRGRPLWGERWDPQIGPFFQPVNMLAHVSTIMFCGKYERCRCVMQAYVSISKRDLRNANDVEEIMRLKAHAVLDSIQDEWVRHSDPVQAEIDHKAQRDAYIRMLQEDDDEA